MRGTNVVQWPIEDWLRKLSLGEIALPEFQRDFVWNRHRVCGFIQAIFRNQPVGCVLILPINENKDERLIDRQFEGMKQNQDIEYKHLLLDGQQRLTALWRAVNENADPTYCYFIKYEPKTNLIEVESHPKSCRWINEPKICFNDKNLIPISLLWCDTDDRGEELIIDWLKQDNGSIDPTPMMWIKRRSEELRNYRLPALEMAPETKKLEAINTFIEINNSSQKLRKFDIVVGEFLTKEEGRLRTIRENAIDEIDDIESYMNSSEVGDLLLKISCLCAGGSGFVPTESNYAKSEVLSYLKENHEKIIDAIRWTIGLLRADKIFDKKRLPSTIPFRVLPALYLQIQPKNWDLSHMSTIARAYLWRVFTTERYAKTANIHLKEDFCELKEVMLRGGEGVKGVPLWNTEKYPLPTEKILIEQTWPTTGTLPKAILAISLRAGARDINTNIEVASDNISTREYHHVFPKKYLEKHVREKEADKALNCILIGAKTNRRIAANPPLEYFKKLYSMLPDGAKITEKDITSRLESHVVPESMLQVTDDREIQKFYYGYLKERAKLVRSHMDKLANGNQP